MDRKRTGNEHTSSDKKSCVNVASIFFRVITEM